MFYSYAEFNDGTRIAYSQILEDGMVEIGIERPSDGGFDSARCRVPSFAWSLVEGFSDEDVAQLERYIRQNLPLIWRLAEEESKVYA